MCEHAWLSFMMLLLRSIHTILEAARCSNTSPVCMRPSTNVSRVACTHHAASLVDHDTSRQEQDALALQVLFTKPCNTKHCDARTNECRQEQQQTSEKAPTLGCLKYPGTVQWVFTSSSPRG